MLFPILLLLSFAVSIDGLRPLPCHITKNVKGDQYLDKRACHYCSRTIVIYMDSITEWKTIHEEAGCADDVDLEETPSGLACSSHLGTNSSGRGPDFFMYYTTRGDTELVAKRCCENFDGKCNREFVVKYPQKYLLRHIRRSPPKMMGIFICIVLLLVYYIFRIFYSSSIRMSYDVTKKEQLKMFGYRDDDLDPAIVESKSKVEEPPHAVSIARTIPTFKDTLNAIFDIQYYQNPKKYDAIWVQSLPKMRKIAESRGLKKPVEKPPQRIKPIPEKTIGLPFYELKNNIAKKTIFSEIIKHKTSSQKILRTQNRPFPSGFSDLLLKLIEHGPYEYPFKAIELFDLFERAKNVFAQDSTVLQLKNNQIVIGDIRGRYTDIFRFFNAFGWPPQRSYLFLGGIIENEEDHSLECMALLAALKTALPGHIFVLRGVGETVPYVPARRFPGRKGDVIGNSLGRLCNVLPVAAVINSRILCTHSGVTTHFKGKNRLNNLSRPFSIEDMTEAGRRIIFAVPEKSCRMFRMRPHEKNGEVYGEKAVQKTLANMKLDLLIRSRSPIAEGYCLHWENSVLSIWSALTSGTTKTAAVEIDASCRVVLHLMDTQASLTQIKEQRVITNVVRAAQLDDEMDEEEVPDEEFNEDDAHRSSSAKKDNEEAEQVTVAKSNVEKEDPEALIEKTPEASDKSGEKVKVEVGGKSKERTTMKDTKESKESTGDTAAKATEKGNDDKTQGSSHSARAIEEPFALSMMEQRTQSVKEWPREGGKGRPDESHKKDKKKEEEREKEDKPPVLKTPDISVKSGKEARSLMQVKTPAREEALSGKKKKEKEPQLEDAIPKSKYEDALPYFTNKEDSKRKSKYSPREKERADLSMRRKNDTQKESMMKDISIRKKIGGQKEDEKNPPDSLREKTKGEEIKKKSKESMDEVMLSKEGSRETEKEAHPKEEYAISEKSLPSNTTKTTKKAKKEEKKEEKKKDEPKKE